MAKGFRNARSKRDIARRSEQRTPKDRVLIVCEGEKTEPYYFRDMIRDLGLNTAKTAAIDVKKSSDSAPIKVVKSAFRHYQQAKKEKASYDKVFCVIDRDNHSTYEEALTEIKNHSLKNTFSVVQSIPCFEYWVLLHYDYVTSPYTHTGKYSPCDCISKKELLKYIPDYAKDIKGLYRLLKEQNPAQAKHNAERALEEAKLNQTDNPSTYIHHLVQYLENLQSGQEYTLPKTIEAHLYNLLPVPTFTTASNDALENLEHAGLDELWHEVKILSASSDTKTICERIELYVNAFINKNPRYQPAHKGKSEFLKLIKKYNPDDKKV